MLLNIFIALWLHLPQHENFPAGLTSGIWRGVIELRDGELPFNFQVKQHDGKYQIELINGEERIQVNEINIEDDSIFIRMPVFDSEFRVKFDSKTMNGQFINHARKDNNIFPFHAEAGETFRFQENGKPPVADLSGRWECDFSKGTPDSSKAVGIFHQDGNHLTGTFLTTTGDYRFLEGNVQGNEFSLSAFDGSHLFLFKGTIISDGILSAVYYSGNHWREPWTAKRNEKFELPDPYSVTQLKPGYSKIDFSFPDVNGKMVSLSDDRFKNKVVVVQITGTWCPNCMDETAFYSPLFDRYRDQGLEVVALDFEKFPDFEKAKQNLSRLQQRFNIHYTLLFAGQVGDEANKALPMLDEIHGYPTSIFIDRKGNVRKIYTGINGPATGHEYEKWKDDTTALIEKLLSEK